MKLAVLCLLFVLCADCYSKFVKEKKVKGILGRLLKPLDNNRGRGKKVVADKIRAEMKKIFEDPAGGGAALLKKLKSGYYSTEFEDMISLWLDELIRELYNSWMTSNAGYGTNGNQAWNGGHSATTGPSWNGGYGTNEGQAWNDGHGANTGHSWNDGHSASGGQDWHGGHSNNGGQGWNDGHSNDGGQGWNGGHSASGGQGWNGGFGTSGDQGWSGGHSNGGNGWNINNGNDYYSNNADYAWYGDNGYNNNNIDNGNSNDNNNVDNTWHGDNGRPNNNANSAGANNNGDSAGIQTSSGGFVNSDVCGQRQTEKRTLLGDLRRLLKHKPRHSIETKVVNGNTASVAEFPWVVALFKTGVFRCGGSLISPSWVLTAAHCVVEYVGNPDDVLLRVGEHDFQSDVEKRQDIVVEKIISHPQFINEGFHNDIALLKLSEPANVAMPHINTVCLSDEDFPVGTKCILAGWGRTVAVVSDRNEILMKADIYIQENYKCPYSGGLDNTQLCAGGYMIHNTLSLPGSCHGDSGGPLFCLRHGVYFQAGVVSYGGICGDPRALGVYTNVSKYILWINSVLNNN